MPGPRSCLTVPTRRVSDRTTPTHNHISNHTTPVPFYCSQGELQFQTSLRADWTHDAGSYDPDLDKDEAYERARRKAMGLDFQAQPGKTNNRD